MKCGEYLSQNIIQILLNPFRNGPNQLNNYLYSLNIKLDVPFEN